MTPERKNELEVVLTNLRNLPGVKDVVSDDFNSISVNVFISLKGTKDKLLIGLRKTKNSIKRTCRCRFLDQPVPAYEYAGLNEPAYRKGYDKLHIKIEVFV